MIQPLFPILILAIGDSDMDRKEKAGGTKKRGRPPKKLDGLTGDVPFATGNKRCQEQMKIL